MKNLIVLLAGIFLMRHAFSQPCITVSETCNEASCGYSYCGPYELSRGVYRLPFVDGTEIEVVCDHFSHCPRGRLDMIGTDGEIGDEYHICAAADGWIRAIVDNHNVQCDCSVSSCENNYVWIEHPNGEWTKYTHMKQNSVANLGHFEDEWVTAGTYLGDEGDVGCAGGVHLHFEAAQPIDTNTLVFSESGGYIDDNWATNVIPVFCSIGGNVMVTGETYVAGDCPSACGGFVSPFTTTYETGAYQVILNDNSISNSVAVTFEGYSSGVFQAGSSVTLKEGFEVLSNATFTARIGDCDEFNLKQAQEDSEAIPNSEDDFFVLYPNPSSGLVTLEFKIPSSEKHQIVLRNALGIIVQESLSENNSVTVVDLTSEPCGVYYLECSSGSKIHTQKVIIMR
jgi:hypothetical protein